MWSKGEFKAVLDAKALLRKGTSSKAEEAALLFARMEGWTEENCDHQQVKKTLDALLDGMEPEDWSDMKKVANAVGDATFSGVLTYAVRRIASAHADYVASLDEIPEPSTSISKRPV